MPDQPPGRPPSTSPGAAAAGPYVGDPPAAAARQDAPDHPHSQHQRRESTGTAARRLAAEFIGTSLLAAVIIGAGIAVARLTGDGALRLLVVSLTTAAGLAVLITVLTPASGAQLNPVVTAADWALTRRTASRYPVSLAATVIACQVTGGIAGSALADAMFSVPVLAVSRQHRGGGPVLLSESVATAGLLLVVVGTARIGQSRHTAWAAGAWIGVAFWFTASSAFANPAVTIARTLTSTYTGIAPASVPAFIAAQAVGGLIGAVLAVAIHRPGSDTDPARTQPREVLIPQPRRQ